MLYVSPVRVMKDDTTDPNKLPDKKVQVDIKLGEGAQIIVGSDTKKGDATNPYVWGTFFLKPDTGLEGGDIPAVEQQPGYKANSVKWDPNDQIKVWNENNPKPEDAIQVSFAKGTGVTALNPEGKTMTVKPNTTLAVRDFPAATVDTANGYAGQALWTGEVPNLGHKVTKDNNVFTATAQRPFDDANITDIAFAKDPDKMSYNEGEPLQLAGLEIKLTDKYGTIKMIGVDELAKYKITIEPKDGTTLTINDHNGKNLTAKGKVKLVAGGEEERTVTSPGKLDVHKKRSGGFFFFPAAEEEKPETAIHKAYIFGYEDDSFKPEGNMTRAEAAAMLARLQGLDLSNDARPDFMDVRSGW